VPFVRRDEGRQRIVAGMRQRGAVNLAFARRGGKAAVGERRRAARYVEAGVAVALQRFPARAGQPRILPVEGLLAEILVAVGKARVGETHAAGETAEEFGVRQRFAARGRNRALFSARKRLPARAMRSPPSRHS